MGVQPARESRRSRSLRRCSATCAQSHCCAQRARPLAPQASCKAAVLWPESSGRRARESTRCRPASPCRRCTKAYEAAFGPKHPTARSRVSRTPQAPNRSTRCRVAEDVVNCSTWRFVRRTSSHDARFLFAVPKSLTSTRVTPCRCVWS